MNKNSVQQAKALPFTKQSIEKFSGREFVHVTEVANEIGVTPQRV